MITTPTTSTEVLALSKELSEKLEATATLTTSITGSSREKKRSRTPKHSLNPSSPQTITSEEAEKVQEQIKVQLQEKTDTVNLTFMGEVSIDSGFSTSDTAKPDEAVLLSFTPPRQSESEKTEDFQSKPLNIRKLTLFDRDEASNKSGLLIETSPVTPPWDFLQKRNFTTKDYTFFLFWDEKLRPLRNRGHASYKGSGASTLSQLQHGTANADTEVDPDKLALQELRLSEIVEIITNEADQTANSLTYQKLQNLIKPFKERLHAVAMINDMVGARINKVSVLLQSESPFSARFLGFEYVCMPEGAFASKTVWDIPEGREEQLVPPANAAATKVKRTVHEMGGVPVLPFYTVQRTNTDLSLVTTTGASFQPPYPSSSAKRFTSYNSSSHTSLTTEPIQTLPPHQVIRHRRNPSVSFSGGFPHQPNEKKPDTK
ncbi:hypothetical protein [Parendozoicomonas sp. Alg238-R29]|uniref:hypothetical protein n=1 Tax=Parendozoicomonas sp. Alg238-R29 TaxID=2993446 RepID=UPI00248D6A51|nr:hypothetical protein [Parendozoicomonas sp. Alg238-R29]